MKRFAVFSIRKSREGEAIWVRAGSAIENRDKSIEVWMDVLPLDGHLHLRDVTTVVENVPAPKKEPT